MDYNTSFPKYDSRISKSFMYLTRTHWIALFDSSKDFLSNTEKLDPCIYCGDNILGLQVILDKDKLQYFSESTIQNLSELNIINSETVLTLKVIKNDELVVETQVSVIYSSFDKDVNNNIILLNLDLRQYNLKTIRHNNYVRFEFDNISGSFNLWQPYIVVICEYDWET